MKGKITPIIMIVAGAIIFMLILSQSQTETLFLADSWCRTQADAQSYAEQYGTARGYCDGYCYAKLDTQCTSSSKQYRVFCDSGNPNGVQFADHQCGIDSLRVDECNAVADTGCDYGYRCEVTAYGNKCYKPEPEQTLSGFTWDSTAENWVHIGCKSDASCGGGQVCRLNSAKTAWECVKGDYVTDVIASQLGGKLSGITYPRKTQSAKEITISGWFLPSETGTYYIEAGINPNSVQELVVKATPGQSCDGSQYYSGGSVQADKGDPVEFYLNIITPTKAGKYTLIVGAYPGCGKSAYDTLTYTIEVLKPVGDEPIVTFTEGDAVVNYPGGDCEIDLVKECTDSQSITALTCVEGVYQATGEACEGDCTFTNKAEYCACYPDEGTCKGESKPGLWITSVGSWLKAHLLISILIGAMCVLIGIFAYPKKGIGRRRRK